MGICAGPRGKIHFGIAEKLTDLTDFIAPDLTVIDAYRVLMDNGPSGGNLDDVSLKKSIIVSDDPVLADAYASTIVNRDPLSIPYIKEAAARNIGSADIANARIESIQTNQ